MPLALFIIVVSIISLLWFVKLSGVVMKAEEADKKEQTEKAETDGNK